MMHRSTEPYVGWELPDTDRHEDHYRERRDEVRHDMANDLSLLQLHLAMMLKVQKLNDDDFVMLQQCLTRLCQQLECWRQLESDH